MPCDQVFVYSVVTLDGLDRRMLESALRQLGFQGFISRMFRGQDVVAVESGMVRVYTSGPPEVLIAEVKRAYAAAAVQKAAKMMGWQVRKVQSRLILERR